MPTNKKNKNDFEPNFLGFITIGERGQVVIPKEAREILSLQKGDKLIALMPHGQSVVLIPASKAKKWIEKMNADITKYL